MLGQICFFIVLLFWVGFDVYLFFFHNRRISGRLQEKRSKYIMLAFVLSGMLGAVAIDGSSRKAFMVPFLPHRYAGVALMVFAIIIRFLVVRQLGPSFAIDVGALPGQELRTDRLFRVIRHPAYAAEIAGFLGLAIVFNNLFSSILAFTLPTTGILYRIAVEERNLEYFFGDAYREYRDKTWRLIPYVF
ncbi:MAG: isoprenylcysteine carboxylmethyltransferase family protein [Kosmotogaceae bacterium]|nr:isoprenylcysteine carboxylmethyltransferase family protein [Kosmotogaceae bacterium]